MNKFIIYCDSDTSFSIVDPDDIIGDLDNLKCGEPVKFKYAKSVYQGKVLVISGNLHF